jgi:SAM-dependent methyltransferase
MTYRPGPTNVSLSDVYAIDFGRRGADLAMWGALRALAPDGPACEVGVGDGRASIPLSGVRYGLDVDRPFVYRARERGIHAFHGDAADPAAWLPIPTDCALVFCAFSTLFLIPHGQQREVLRQMVAHLRPSGILAVETFLPSREVEPVRDVAVGNPNGIGAPWVRRTVYEVRDLGDGTGTTKAHRLYGPDSDDWRMSLEEVIHWRTRENLLAVLFDLGLDTAYGATRNHTIPGGLRPTIPEGSVLTTWTKHPDGWTPEPTGHEGKR